MNELCDCDRGETNTEIELNYDMYKEKNKELEKTNRKRGGK